MRVGVADIMVPVWGGQRAGSLTDRQTDRQKFIVKTKASQDYEELCLKTAL